MPNQLFTERVADLGSFRRASASSLQFLPQDLAHIYVKLEFEHTIENARSSDDARGFLRSVARAATAADLLARNLGGALLEVQGSLLHIAIPTKKEAVLKLAGDLHGVFSPVFGDAGRRVKGWRMAADCGKTLVVEGRGVHGDSSYVSLGQSANRPAKHLYAEMAVATEDDRRLKRHHIAIRAGDTWKHVPLASLPRTLSEATSIVEAARDGTLDIDFRAFHGSGGGFQAQAAPVHGPGGSPIADRPQIYFGWVMRCDLDGFTARVQKCLDDDEDLEALAREFGTIMDEAAAFVERNQAVMIQLPWAGDNFTAAAVFTSKANYDEMLPSRLVELSLDFEKEMAQSARDAGFGGWAQAVAGGEVHGNSNGNVYVASVSLGSRRFLVGVGEGFGRSAQAFVDIAPDTQTIVAYEPDWARTTADYRGEFKRLRTGAGEVSSLFRGARVVDLLPHRAMRSMLATPTVVTTGPDRQQAASGKPYAR